jgi:hypothetical protein
MNRVHDNAVQAWETCIAGGYGLRTSILMSDALDKVFVMAQYIPVGSLNSKTHKIVYSTLDDPTEFNLFGSNSPPLAA